MGVNHEGKWIDYLEMDQDFRKKHREAGIKISHILKKLKTAKENKVLELILKKPKTEKENKVLEDLIQASETVRFRLVKAPGPKSKLSFPARFLRVAGLILEQDPDVITMQELDRYDEMKAIMEACGYEGAYKQKRKGGACSKFYPGSQMDGVAIFWKKSRIENLHKTRSHELVKDHKIMIQKKGNDWEEYDPDRHAFSEANRKKFGEFKQKRRVGLERSLCEGKFDWKYKLKPVYGKQVVLSVKLRNRDSTRDNKDFYVVTAHCKSGPTYTDIKEKQYMAMTLAEEFHKEYKDAPVVFGADFNANKETTAFKLFFNGSCKELTEEHELYEMIKKGGKKVKTYERPNGEKYTLPEQKNVKFAMNNFFDHTYPLDGPYTVVKWRKGGKQKEKLKITTETIDFICHSKGHFETKGLLSVPEQEVVEKASPTLMPGWKYPSDHFFIGADLEMV